MSDPTSDRLQAIQGELQQILEARLGELAQTLRGSEQVTRRIVSAEIEIERHRATAQQLEAETAGLSAELEEARALMAGGREAYDMAVAERDRHRAKVGSVEASVRELRAEVESTRQQAEALDRESEILRSENATLKNKLATLEENVLRMRRLREELMTSVSGLTQEMTGLAGGGNE